MALMHDEFGRALARLRAARETVRVGKLSGAVGTHAHLDPKIEAAVCKKLGLKPAAISTQILQRDRHAEFAAVLALVGTSVERWAQEFRHLQRTEVREVEEFFRQGQKGSSAMPHKRNPVVPNSCAGWRGCCAAMRWRPWKTCRCGTSATFRIRPRSGSSCPTRRFCWTTCWTSWRR
jgi:adenylosuccinate lyase